ncbi:Tyrosine recombinase XerD [Acetobacterium wieringae]|uniref:tyrosine-type recombinase/integrase n=1 Tax=Acetobacterium wieringae TaxID=52694 RepID=UPI001DCBE13A|nr:site-specific integrase [Acetobacterium wieringae]VUZ28483.1 Tyrosine recombinase XerD [Acetobacterium wieringae]
MKYDKVKRGDKIYFRHRVYDPVTQKTKDVTATSLKELKSKAEKIESKVKFGIADDKVQFGKFMKDWIETVHLIDKKQTTVERYRCLYRNQIENTRLSKIKLKDLRSEDVQEHYNKLFKERGSSSQVKSLNKLVAPCIRYAYETQRILKDFSKALKIPIDNNENLLKKQNETKVHPLTKTEQLQFIEACKGHRLEALFNVALDTGMRQGELLALLWTDIDFDSKEISINKTVNYVRQDETKKRVKEISTPKTKNSVRVIPLPDRTKDILLTHRIRQRERLIRFGKTREADTPVFSTSVGTHFERQAILKIVKSVYAKAGIEGKNFHDLRHTYATRLFELGEQPKTVQMLLGHSNVSTTLNVYTHVLDDLKVKSASKIDQFYAENTLENTTNPPLWENSGKIVYFKK